MTQHLRLFLIVFSSLLFTGCAPTPKTLYQWENYQTHLYDHFKNDGKGLESTIAAMEDSLRTIDTDHKLPPPGFHAHLGLLYSIAGKNAQAATHFQLEKKLFPESTAYMDFLLGKIQH